MSDIEAVVRDNEKKRFMLNAGNAEGPKEDGTIEDGDLAGKLKTLGLSETDVTYWIRANQGHTLEVRCFGRERGEVILIEPCVILSSILDNSGGRFGAQRNRRRRQNSCCRSWNFPS